MLSRRAWHLVWPIAALLQIAGFFDLRHDDAFITFRYGQNLALGHGLTFNPGERLMGSTSPGQALASAGVYALFGRDATPSVMSALGCLAWTLQGYALWLLLRELRAQRLGPERAALICGAVLAGVADSWQWVALETNIALALGLAALAAAQRGRWQSAALAVGAACLMRPDALLLAGLLLVWCWRERRAAAARPALVFAGVVAPWLVFAQLYFGSVLPRSLHAKLQRASLSEYASHFARHTTRLISNVDDSLLAQLVVAGLVVGGVAALARGSLALRWLAVYGALHGAAYLVLRSVTGHDWHLYPSVLVASVLACAGALELALRLALRVTAAGERGQRALVVAVGALLVSGFAARTAYHARSHGVAYWNGARDTVYRAIAEQMRANTPTGERFASVEVGTLAYYTQLPAFDIGMLVSDRKQRPATHIRWVVLDDTLVALAPPWPALGEARTGEPKPFGARLYAVPSEVAYFDILHAHLQRARKAQGLE